MPFAPGLKRAREQAVLSQSELANKAGIARPTLSRIEKGQSEARPRTIRKLAAALNIDPQQLLHIEVEH